MKSILDDIEVTRGLESRYATMDSAMSPEPRRRMVRTDFYMNKYKTSDLVRSLIYSV